MKKFVDYYRVLGVKKSASKAEVRTAFLALAKKYHPDRGGSNETMDSINEAYTVLKDYENRTSYNEVHRQHYRKSKNDDDVFFDEEEFFSASTATVEQAIKQQAKVEVKRGLAWVTCNIFVSLVLYVSLSSGILYVLAWPFFGYGLWRFAQNSFLFFCPRYEIGDFRTITTKQTSALMRSIGLVLVILILSGATAVIARSQKQGNDELVGSPIYSSEILLDVEITKLESLRKSYDECLKNFQATSNQLNRVNLELDSAGVRGDSAGYNRLSIEQSSLLETFTEQRKNCATIQSEYSKQIDEYRKRTQE